MAKTPRQKLNPAGIPPGSNSGATAEQISDDQIQALTRQHAAKRAVFVAAEKTAKAARMNHDKIIKADLGATGLKDIKDLEWLSTPEGEAALKIEMSRQERVARWAGLQIGFQSQLFGVDARPLSERAFDEGKRAGMNGEAPNPPQNYSPASEGFNGWMEGWQAGQTAIFAIKQTQTTDSNLLRPAGNEDSTGDELDDAADGEGAGKPGDDGGGGGDEWPDSAQIAARAAKPPEEQPPAQ